MRLGEAMLEQTAQSSTGSIEHAQDAARNEVVSRIVIDATKSFLSKDVSELRRVGVTPQRFFEAYEARNEFYQALAGNPDVRGIGFDESPFFPIRRKDFALLQVPAVAKEEAVQDIEWEVELVLLKVTSPNWDMNDDKRPWKGKDQLSRERFFRIDDAQFWHYVHTKQLDPQIIDTILVQLAFPKGQRRRGRVLRVLKFNDDLLGEPLDDNALSALLGSYRRPDKGGDLFASEAKRRPPEQG